MKKKFLTGVYMNKQGAYVGTIYYEGKAHYLGAFATEIEAHKAYLKQRELHPKNVQTTFIIPPPINLVKTLNEKDNPLLIENQMTKIDMRIKPEPEKKGINHFKKMSGTNYDWKKKNIIKRMIEGKSVPYIFQELKNQLIPRL